MDNRITKVGAAAGGCNNIIVTTSSQTIAKPDVGSSVFVVVRKLDLLILGCFNERFKAEKWANGSVGLAIQELKVN